MAVGDHRDLMVWKKSIDIAKACYQITEAFPRNEQFGLTSQIRRASISVSANISEGKAYGQSRSMLHFLQIAIGSLAELDTHWEIALQLGYISESDCRNMQANLDEVSRMLIAFRQTIASSLI
ncbi:four helix bundle protein [Planctopirus hydrillae]|uniref:Four helix bundle protein n=1 Tax=Planctopirus hydrillae TaxID=1841610 RepID=A0A1C3EMY8_9PLAN|nr:four helix bundle protein [Planctopirus hydrillae]ODA34594.1 hypothetical protein A6X21_02615 [Planctopirus hydrillae]